jgi:hypothetical protein
VVEEAAAAAEVEVEAEVEAEEAGKQEQPVITVDLVFGTILMITVVDEVEMRRGGNCSRRPIAAVSVAGAWLDAALVVLLVRYEAEVVP